MKSFHDQAIYTSVPQAECSNIEDFQQDEHYSHTRHASSSKSSQHRSLFTHGLAALTTFVITLALTTVSQHRSTHPEQDCVERFSTWSPAREAVSYKKPEYWPAETQQTNRWRVEWNEDPRLVDDAWDAIGIGAQAIRLVDEDLPKLNKAEPQPLTPLHKIPDEAGGGYLGELEVFHQLHCLAAIREGLFYHWDYYKNTSSYDNASMQAIITHHNHCVDVLRLTIMCHADVTPVTLVDPVLNPRRRLPVGDFSTLHTCRDFDKILNWAKTNPRRVLWKDSGIASTYKQGMAQEEEESRI